MSIVQPVYVRCADNEVRVGRFMAEMAREAPNFRRNLVLAFGKNPQA